jgi:cyanophycin synthetase
MSNLGLRWIAEYHGPNPVAPAAVVVAELSADITPNVSQVLQAAEAVWRHSGLATPASDASPPEIVEDGLLVLGQAAASWARAALNEVRGYVLHAGAVRLGDRVRIWIGFHQPELSRDALILGLRYVAANLRGAANLQELKSDLNQLLVACKIRHPDYQARILMVAAQKRKIPFFPFLADTRYWQFGWSAHGRVFFETSSNEDGFLGWQWQRNKPLAKNLMAALCLPIAPHVLVGAEDELEAAAARIGYPCVMKPTDSGGGKGVTAGIGDMESLRSAFQQARRYSQQALMLEKHVSGADHRLMVADGRFVAAIRREPSFVTGDGRSTVAQLVDQLNVGRSSNLVRSRYLRPIAIDHILIRHLAEQNLILNDIPTPDRKITLRSNANLSTGGICTDVTSECHAELRSMVEGLAVTCGISTSGFDYITTDIARPAAETGGIFIEMNTTPGLGACVAAGWPEEAIGESVLGHAVGRIPIGLTVLSAGGMDRARQMLVDQPLAEGDACACEDMLRVGASLRHVTTVEPWAAARSALRNKAVQRLHIFCSAEAIQRWGLPVDHFKRSYVEIHESDSVLSDDWLRVIVRSSEREIILNISEELIRENVRFYANKMTRHVISRGAS